MRLLTLLAAQASACPFCFGDVGPAGLSSGIFWGLIVLIIATFTILSVFIWSVVRMEKRKAHAEAHS
jgi:hypothetical protein